MLLDHIAEFFPETPIVLHWIGRLAAPLFVFALAEGFAYTSSKKKYLLRLYAGAVLMGAFDIIMQYWQQVRQLTIYQPENHNIFVTLFATASIFSLCSLYRKNRKQFYRYMVLYILWQVSIPVIYVRITQLHTLHPVIQLLKREAVWGAVTGSALMCEGGIIMVLYGLCIYGVTENRKKLSIRYGTFCGLYFLVTITSILPRIIYRLMWHSYGDGAELLINLCLICEVDPFGIEPNILTEKYQWMMIGALPIMLCYNGKKGKGYKWLFYIVYSLQFLLLFIVRMLADCL